MPDWAARAIRTAVQVGLGTLVWAAIKVLFLRDITPEQDFAVQALITGLGTVVIAGLQNAGESAGVIPTLLKPVGSNNAKVVPVR